MNALKLTTRTVLAGALGIALLSPTVATAQSIAGVVKDTSGAVLPGVTVEASSPALIERTRSTVTDERGQYQIVDLRPGNYVMSFTLSGFATARREARTVRPLIFARRRPASASGSRRSSTSR